MRDLRGFGSSLSLRNRALRLLWNTTSAAFFARTPRTAHFIRRGVLRAFGAKVGKGAKIYPGVQIWAPWNVEIGKYAVIGDYVDCYSVARISIGAHTIVSQYTHLCAASHNYEAPEFPLVSSPIRIEDGVWIAAGAFIGPGITVGRESVVGARACVTKQVMPFDVVVGNPAQVIKTRAR